MRPDSGAAVRDGARSSQSLATSANRRGRASVRGSGTRTYLRTEDEGAVFMAPMLLCAHARVIGPPVGNCATERLNPGTQLGVSIRGRHGRFATQSQSS